jgi:phosphate/sulfate permease
MPIYDIFETKEEESTAPEAQGLPESEVLTSPKDRFFSSLTARVLFFLLLVGDICWGIYALFIILSMGPLNLLTGGKIGFLNRLVRKNWISLKRSGICGVSLFISLFSPALGIMIACTYFMMYDKTGIQEVVPRSLQEQFQEFLR